MKKALVIINVTKDESMTLAKDISLFLNDKGIEVDRLSFDGFCDNFNFEGYDFVVTLGGDGTVLFAARNSVNTGVPIFPVNLGAFGFLAPVHSSEWREKLITFMEGKAEIAERTLLQASVIRNGKKIYSSLGLNDAVISASGVSRILALNVLYDSLFLCKLKSDGVIVSTSTGSTAYSAAAGGPIIDPSVDALVMTPINAFSLSARPIVLNPNGKLSIQIEKSRNRDITLNVDGQESVVLQPGDAVEITRLEGKAKLAYCTNDNFYDALRSKLNWSGGPHA